MEHGAKSESNGNSWNAFPPAGSAIGFFTGTPMSWKIEISFSAAAKSVAELIGTEVEINGG